MRKDTLYILAMVAGLVAASLPAVAAPVKIVCMGDSITRAVREGVTEAQSFEALLQDWLGERIVAVEVINEGIGGEKTNQALARLAKDVVARKPDYVTIMYGTNDSYVDKGKTKARLTLEDYTKNLRLLVTRLRAAGIRPILMTSPPLGDKVEQALISPYYKEYGRNYLLVDYVQAVRTIAREQAVPLVDNFAAWAEAAFMGTDIDSLMVDGCHPNPAGHELLARMMYPVLARLLGGDARPPGTPAQPPTQPAAPPPTPAAVQAGDNLALGKRYAETSHNKYSQWSEGLTDGINNTDGSSGGYATWTEDEYPKLTTIDLGASYQVGRVLVYNMAEGPTRNIILSVSGDGQAFTEVGKHQFGQGDGAVYECKFEPRPACYVRISFLDNYPVDFHGSEHFMVVREIEVFSE